MARTIFIGDVHGCLDELRNLVSALDMRHDDRLLFTGDLVDKGPDSVGVLRHVRLLMGLHPGSVVVSGNHEEKALRFHEKGKEVEPWVRDASAEDWDFIRAMPLMWSDPSLNVRVVHGGIFPALLRKSPDAFAKVQAAGADWRRGGGKAMDRARRMLRTRFVGGPAREEHQQGEMLALGENREGDPFWAETFKGPETVIFGHSPWLDGKVKVWPFAVGIDTGAVFGGNLTALVMSNDIAGRSEVVQVAATKRHAEPREEPEA
jgi:hypothetical protein